MPLAQNRAPIARPKLAFTLVLLFSLNFMNFYDRHVVGAIGERIKVQWGLSDAQLGALTTAFILLYAVVGIPLGRWADRGRRRTILGLGAIVWSAFTGLSGVAWGFASLFVFRMGVGVGEASCAPTANSLIGDLFPAEQRGRAISVFMLGLPLGAGASFLISGALVQATGGWREALLVAAVPGVLLGILAFFLPEPERGSADHLRQQSGTDQGAIRAILSIPTMRWIIASGALLNLNMYVFASFLTSYAIRIHGMDIGQATRLNSVLLGFGGGMGMLCGGWLGDRLAWGGPARGRLRLAAAALFLAAPLVFLALELTPGRYWPFALLMFPVCFLHYVYYSTVYASIQDVVEPTRRGTAMAVYFLAFYIATAAGLYGFGELSDALAARSGREGGAAAAIGLHDAMYMIPIVALLVGAVLWAGSRTVERDRARMLERA